MAKGDIISRLRLDSGEFDAKIKRAGQELLAYSEHCKKMGLEMGYANKDAKDFAKALGDMNTVSQAARGKLNELTEAFVNLKAMYNNMTDAEKQNPFGKELAASIDKLKNRIDEAKQNLNSVNAELGNTKQAEQGATSGIEGLTSALGINVKSLVGWGAALTAGKVALDVAKDAFMSSETNVDDWGRTVRSAEGIYQSFVQSLNTGDFTGFLNNIGRVTQAAQEAYNALDELGTRMTIINPERARLQARQQELRADIRRNGADSEVGRAALAELKKIEPLLSKSFKTESQMNYTAFEKLVRERLAEGGINLNQRSFEQFMKTFSSDAAFQNLRRNARGSSELRETSEIGKFRTVDTRNIEQKLLDLFTDEWRQANSGYLTASFSAQGAAASNALGNARYMRAGSGGGKGGKGGKTDIQFADDSIMAQEKLVQELTQKWKTASGELRDGYLKDLEEAQQKLAELTGKAKGPDLDKLFPDMSKQNYNTGYAGSAQAKADSAIADFAQGGVGNADISGFISSAKQAIDQSELGDDLYNKMTEKLKDATMFQSVLTQAIAGGASAADLSGVAQEIKQKLLEGDIDESAWQEFLDKINELIQNADLKLTFDVDTKNVTTAVKKQKKETAEMAKEWQAAGTAIQAVGSAMSQIEDPAAKVLGIIAQAVATMALSYSQAAASPAVTGSGWGWIAFAATGLATMISSINGIKNATQGFAQGGIVGGNSYSGDNTLIRANAGELVLTKSQQNTLAGALEGNGLQDLQLATVISAEEIRFVLRNNGRRTGRGEYITSRNSRS